MGRRGVLRVYLGAAPGVGKTYAMLDEGHRRAARGADVVVGVVETHGRPHTADRLVGLEVVPRREVVHRGATFTELDVAAVLTRSPDLVLVDELAHSNVAGGSHEKRWQDVEELLEAGIDVVSTVNVQHLESLNDVVLAITGAPQRETVPDAVVRAAEQVELVDMTPEALRRRMAHGNVYRADRVDAALANYFRPGNLAALRELALLWLADAVDEGLARYRRQHGIADTWETRERVVVALTGGPEGDTLIRRASRIAARAGAGDLLAVHVARSDGLVGTSAAALSEQRTLVESLGGSYHSVVGDDVATAVLAFARANNATQVVIGASRRRPLLAALTAAGTGLDITRRSGSIDVHVVSHAFVGQGRRLPPLTGGLSTGRRVAGLVVAAVLLAALVPILSAWRDELGFSSDILLFLLAVVVVSLVGGFYPAVATAVAAGLLLNFFFVEPLHQLTIADPDNALALVVFVLVAVLVSRVVDIAARRTTEAARSNAEAETLSAFAEGLLRGGQEPRDLLERVRETFGVQSATLLERVGDAPGSAGTSTGLRGSWRCVTGVGEDSYLSPGAGDTEVPVGDDLALVLRGRTLAARDRRMLAAVAAQVVVAHRQQELAAAAQAAAPLAAADRTRTALLNAVSHDLRTPIASAKAAVSSLRTTGVAWTPADRQELLAVADDALDRLTGLVTDLLDLSRLRAAVLVVETRPVDLSDVIGQALAHQPRDARVTVDLPGDDIVVLADPGLLERVLANLMENALRHTPTGTEVRVSASGHDGRVECRVVDHGPGIARADRERVFAPFQRRDDHAAGTGVGLGLAIARGFVEAMAGTVELDDTPGGGLTAVVTLPAAAVGMPADAPVGARSDVSVPAR